MGKFSQTIVLSLAIAAAACSNGGRSDGPLFQCQATDDAGNIYTAESADQVTASDGAMQQCQYTGPSPTTCQSTSCKSLW